MKRWFKQRLRARIETRPDLECHMRTSGVLEKFPCFFLVLVLPPQMETKPPLCLMCASKANGQGGEEQGARGKGTS